MSAVTLSRAGHPRSVPRHVERVASGLLVFLVAVVATLLAGRAAGVRPLVEHTGSMSPAISVGDLLISHRVPALSVRKGDIVTFPDPLHPGIPTTHRVVVIERSGATLVVTTRGDANPAAEQWTTPVGGTVRRVALTIPHAGRVVAALGGRWARIAVLLMACIGLATTMLLRIWRA